MSNIIEKIFVVNKSHAWIRLGFNFIPIIILIVFGTILFTKSKKYNIKTIASVSDNECKRVTRYDSYGNSLHNEECIVKIVYKTKNGENIKTIINTGPPGYNKGEQIDIEYNPSDPKSAVIGGDSKWMRKASYAAYGCALSILLISIITLILSYKRNV